MGAAGWPTASVALYYEQYAASLHWPVQSVSGQSCRPDAGSRKRPAGTCVLFTAQRP